MKINQNTNIEGSRVVLVPYRETHVLKYHEWMTSLELQQLTASEPLSLEEEYEMQKSWANDEDKCTFIALDKQKLTETGNEVDAMIGDTNIFLIDPENRTTAEIDVMIAETAYRGKGRGKETTLLMLRYGIEKLGIERYVAKIGMDNVASRQMFEKLGFEETSRSDVFAEVTLTVDSDHEPLASHLRDLDYTSSNH